MDFQSDSQLIIDIIATHPCKDAIISMFKKGPPKGAGFMWCDEKDSYWTENEREGLKIATHLVLSNGYESSGYGCMMRELQKKIMKIV